MTSSCPFPAHTTTLFQHVAFQRVAFQLCPPIRVLHSMAVLLKDEAMQKSQFSHSNHCRVRNVDIGVLCTDIIVSKGVQRCHTQRSVLLRGRLRTSLHCRLWFGQASLGSARQSMVATCCYGGLIFTPLVRQLMIGWWFKWLEWMWIKHLVPSWTMFAIVRNLFCLDVCSSKHWAIDKTWCCFCPLLRIHRQEWKVEPSVWPFHGKLILGLQGPFFPAPRRFSFVPPSSFFLFRPPSSHISPRPRCCCSSCFCCLCFFMTFFACQSVLYLVASSLFAFCFFSTFLSLIIFPLLICFLSIILYLPVMFRFKEQKWHKRHWSIANRWTLEHYSIKSLVDCTLGKAAICAVLVLVECHSSAVQLGSWLSGMPPAPAERGLVSLALRLESLRIGGLHGTSVISDC